MNELVPGEDTTEAAEQDNDVVVNTLEDELDVESELSNWTDFRKGYQGCQCSGREGSTGTGNRNKVETPAAEEKKIYIFRRKVKSETTANGNHDNARRDSNTGTAGNSGILLRFRHQMKFRMKYL